MGGLAASNAPLPGNDLPRYVAKLHPLSHSSAHYGYSGPADCANEVPHNRGTEEDVGQAFDASPLKRRKTMTAKRKLVTPIVGLTKRAISLVTPLLGEGL